MSEDWTLGPKALNVALVFDTVCKLWSSNVAEETMYSFSLYK